MLSLLLLAVGLAPAIPCAYLLWLALRARTIAAPVAAAAQARFDVVVPAHDEEGGIARTIASLKALAYPVERYRVVVVADNCTDGTAAAAEAAGAHVLRRVDAERRGKGYALALGFESALAAGVDAVVVVDADTTVSPNLLAAFAAHLAAGGDALQAEYGVRNADASWRTRLMQVALALFHRLRSLARERSGLSCGLRGNGMCFRAEVVRRVPPRAFSIVEDLEYGIELALAGYRVRYVPEAEVLGDMAESAGASRVQRRRWEGGRRRLLRRELPRLLRHAWGERSAVLLDLAADLVVPPLAQLTAFVTIGLGLSAGAVLTGHAAVVALGTWAFSALALVVYVGRGWAISGTGVNGLWALAYAPIYVVWKLGLALRPSGDSRVWTRTPRKRPEQC
jgi:GT2 family glycosyltransferase